MVQAITEEDGVHRQWYDEAKKQTLATLPEFTRHLSEDYGHDYGTICHAVAASAIAAARAMNAAPCGGITGFQAGAVMWEFISEWQGYRDKPLRLVRYEDMLYPQYEDHFDRTISPETWTWLQEEARKRLRERDGGPMSGAVVDHWQSIVDGRVPFGYRVKAE